MKLYAPKYYKEFKCIADKCPHSCCIGWEIDVDADSYKKYQTLENQYGEVIRNSISNDGSPHFRLDVHDRCPHLNERGLCRIILNVGEDYICDICREHPRFYNYTDVAEVGIGMSCPEAAWVILSSPDYAVAYDIGNVNAEPDDVEFNGRIERGRIYEILQNTESDYSARLQRICLIYSIDEGEDSEWLARLDSLEYLDNDHKGMLMTYSSARRPINCDVYLERFLAYLIYRHCTEAIDREDFCSRLRFCLFCERLLASLLSNKGTSSLQDVILAASMISEEIEYSDDNTYTLMY